MFKRDFDPATPPSTIRTRIDKAAERWSKSPEGIRVTAAEGAPVPSYWIEPEDAVPGRTIFYLHGGGYLFGGLSTHKSLVARLALEAKARALIVDYRLAPEHPFPAAVEDALTAYRWLRSEGIKPSQTIFAGDSAGGGLTLATLMGVRDGGEQLPSCAILMSPWTDLALSGWTMLTHAKKDPMLTLKAAALGARHYLQDSQPTHPLASPLYGDFNNLPPLLIHVGSTEILRDDSVRVADKAASAGVDVSIEVWDRMPHVFQAFPMIPESRASLARMGQFVSSKLERRDAARQAA